MEGTIESLRGCHILRAYLVKDENAPKDMLMQCIQNLFSECAQAEAGDHKDAAGQCAASSCLPCYVDDGVTNVLEGTIQGAPHPSRSKKCLPSIQHTSADY
jgi:hypothetical protein